MRTTKVHLRRLVRIFDIRYMERMVYILSACKTSEVYLVSVVQQAGFSLTWSENSNERVAICNYFDVSSGTKTSEND